MVAAADDSTRAGLLALRGSELLAADDATRAAALCLRGSDLMQAGFHHDALDLLDRASDLDPESDAIGGARGMALLELGRFSEAEAELGRTLRTWPLPAFYHCRGLALARLGRHADAAACYAGAMALDPGRVDSEYERAVSLMRCGRHADALPTLEEFAGIAPDCARYALHHGDCLSRMGRHAESLAVHARAAAKDPDDVSNAIGAALARLMLGDLAGGWFWVEYEELLFVVGARRWLMRRPDPVAVRRCLSTLNEHSAGLDRPTWGGSPLRGRSVLLFADFGLGDLLMLVRYAAEVKRRGAGAVVLSAPAGMARLLATVPGVDVIVEAGDPLPPGVPIDLLAPIVSLPALVGVAEATIPRPPYVRAEADRVEAWRRRLGGHGFRVGIHWRGSAADGLEDDPESRRSIRLDEFAALAAVPGVRLVSLQKGPGATQLGGAGFPVESFEDLDGDGKFLDTAALMAGALDLVVSNDTSVCHLAGAIGCPAWVAIPVRCDWRWQAGRSDSPWYPTLRLFRQRRPGDWHSVFAGMAAELARPAGSCGAGDPMGRASGAPNVVSGSTP